MKVFNPMKKLHKGLKVTAVNSIQIGLKYIGHQQQFNEMSTHNELTSYLIMYILYKKYLIEAQDLILNPDIHAKSLLK